MSKYPYKFLSNHVIIDYIFEYADVSTILVIMQKFVLLLGMSIPEALLRRGSDIEYRIHDSLLELDSVPLYVSLVDDPLC